MTIEQEKNKALNIFFGNSNPLLAKRICHCLNVQPRRIKVNKFSDGEIQIEIKEDIKGQDVFIIQSTCSPVNDNLLELLLIVDALKRSAARNIIAVIPYYGYARQDKLVAEGSPISAKLVANLLVTAGVNKVISIDLHSKQIQGFFDIPVENINIFPLINEYISSNFPINEIVFVSPDIGGAMRARYYAKFFRCKIAIIDKERSAPNQSTAMAIVGDVKNKTAIVLDDIIDTAGTLSESSNLIKQFGANSIHVFCTHAVLSGSAIQKINNSPIDSLFTTDTIPMKINENKIKTLSVDNLLSKSIMETYTTIF